MRKHFQNIFYLVTIGAVIWFLYDQRDKVHLVRNISILQLALIIAMTHFSMLFAAYIFNLILRFFNVRLSYRYWFGITVVNAMYNYILPFKGGVALTGYYLKKNYDLKYTGFLSLVAGNGLVILVVSALLGSALGMYLFTQGVIDREYIITIIAGLGLTVAVGLALLLASGFRFKREGKVFTALNQVLEGLMYFRQHPVTMLHIMGIQILFMLAMSYKLFIIFKALGMETSFAELVFIQSLVIFSRLFSFTPGNIGVAEGIVGLSASILGMNMETALLAALIDRFISTLYVFATGIFYSRLLIGSLNREEISRSETGDTTAP